MRPAKVILYGALLGAIFWGSTSAADMLSSKADGWHTWQVDEPGASTEMCCFTWKRGDKTRQGCNLDGHSISFSDGGDCAAAPGTIQVYVRINKGEPKDIRVLSSNCPVTSKSEVTDHGIVASATNLNWFRSIIEDRSQSSDAREEALFGLVQSQSDAAYDYLDSLLSQR
jgi:hypothetical protein